MLTDLKQLNTNGSLRRRVILDSHEGNTISINGKSLINFSSNDYLGIATHPKVKKAFIDGVGKYGFGSGASALISGYYRPHQVLEERFADFLAQEKALLFNSGYHANLGIISALATRGSTIISDKLCHASILDGAQLSRAKHYRFKHNDLNHLKKIISLSKPGGLLITESVFSMEGDIAPIEQLVALSKKSELNLIIDDAHGFGTLQKGGAREYFNLSPDAPLSLVIPLGKAIGGMGAIITGKKDLIQFLVQFARTYKYTTSLPPAIAVALLAALEVLQQEVWRQEKLKHIIIYFINQAKLRGLPLVSENLTPIKPIFIIGNHNALKLQQTLMQYGYFVSCIRAPTVPKGTERLRISLNCMHEEKDIDRFLNLCEQYYKTV